MNITPLRISSQDVIDPWPDFCITPKNLKLLACCRHGWNSRFGTFTVMNILLLSGKGERLHLCRFNLN